MTEPGKARSRFSLDTNILVYSVDTKDPSRHRLAVEIVDHATAAECWLTLQAISSFIMPFRENG
jgi:predicted nucleic acid-binding protein